MPVVLVADVALVWVSVHSGRLDCSAVSIDYFQPCADPKEGGAMCRVIDRQG